MAFGTKTFSYKFIRTFTEPLETESKGLAYSVETAMKGINNADDKIRRSTHTMRSHMDDIDRHLAAGYSISELYTSALVDLNTAITARTTYWEILNVALTEPQMTEVRDYLAASDVRKEA